MQQTAHAKERSYARFLSPQNHPFQPNSMEKQAPPGLQPQPCSVCLEPVSDGGGDRSIAKLKCGHHFHLDCIGSAFNAKGTMQCPNCRHIEEGQWRYANGYRRQDEFTLEDMIYGEGFDIYAGVSELFLPHEEMFGHMEWCPYRSSYPQFSLSVEEVGHSSTGHTDLTVNVLVGDPASSFSPVHPCPFINAQASRHVSVPHGGSWIQPNATGRSVENGAVHSRDRSRYTHSDMPSLSRPGEIIGMQLPRIQGDRRQSDIFPGHGASGRPPLQPSSYSTANAHSGRPRGRTYQMPRPHFVHPHGRMTVHGATWGTAVGQEAGFETGHEGASSTQWRSNDVPMFPLFPLEPESHGWMQPTSQPSSGSYQSGNLYGADLAVQGSLRISEGSLGDNYPGHFSVFSSFSDSQADIGPLHPSSINPR